MIYSKARSERLNGFLKKEENKKNIIRFLGAGIIITIISQLTDNFCGDLGDAGVDVPFRPPGWVFAVVWPCLYITTGTAWVRSRRDPKVDILYILLITLLCLWLLFYSCDFGSNKMWTKNMPHILAASTIGIAILLSSYLTFFESFFNLPMTIWLSFAESISIYELIKIT